MLQLISDKDQTLKQFTENNYAQGSFFWNYLLKNKEIRVNGVRVGKDVRIQSGDVICYYLSKKQEEKAAFYTVYEDENVLIVDKESGVNSEAVFAALQRRYAAEGRACFFIHRLDRNTKGLLAFALSQESETTLLQAFKNRNVEKTYHALCFGDFAKQREVLTGYLKKDAEKSLSRVYDQPQKGAEQIITEYAVEERFLDGTTLVKVTLHTGKTHQIRAHLAHIGCPIVGDMKYGLSEENKRRNLSRQCLVAKCLTFQAEGFLGYLNDCRFVSRFEAKTEE
ncbi:MAG: RluA family pseudouridine synthase [Clostridia bacterium]|nr:RluA family pseudouridine synthase [Clostridia bacterium]